MKNLANLTKMLLSSFNNDLNACNKQSECMEIVSIEIKPKNSGPKRSFCEDVDDDGLDASLNGHKSKQIKTEHQNYEIKLELKISSSPDDGYNSKSYEECLEYQSQEIVHSTLADHQNLVDSSISSPQKTVDSPENAKKAHFEQDMSICLTNASNTYMNHEQTIIVDTPVKQNYFEFQEDFIKKAILKSSTRLTCLNTSMTSLRKESIKAEPTNSENLTKTHINDYRSYNFVFSLLKADLKDSVRAFITKIGSKVVDDVQAGMSTHLIVQSDDDLICSVTAKYLKALANKLWIVSVQWVVQCIKEKQLLDMAPFEIKGDCIFGVHYGPTKARLSSQSLFENYQFLFSGKFSSTFLSAEDLVQLARQCGATIVDTAKSFQTDKIRMVIFEEKSNRMTVEKANFMLESAQIYSVNSSWFFDSLACHQVKAMGNYALYSIQNETVESPVTYQ
jgi:hypothetical protein